MTLPRRVNVYLEARRLQASRDDAAPGKTRNTIKCVPPNKKCGKRCIPPNWNCRATGGGLDSHSRVVQFDPVKGTASVIRGVKNVTEGVKKGDPERLARGLGGVERGIVKLTPGNSAEQKQRFRRRVKAVITVGFVSAVTGIAALKSHQALKKGFKSYREGIGAEVDRAARVAVDRTTDLWDQGMNRAGLGGVFGTGRAEIRARGAGATNRLAYQDIVSRAAQNRAEISARERTFLATRARLRAPGVGMAAVNEIDIRARTENWTYEQWQAHKVHALYSMQTPGPNGKSVFAQPAAHELLARQWGFELPSRPERWRSGAGAVGDINDEITRVRSVLLPRAIGEMHTDLRTDLRRRGFSLTPKGFSDYVDAVLEENPTLLVAPNARTTRARRMQLRERMLAVLNASDAAKQRSLANSTYNSVVDFYDSYFKDAASRLAVDENGKPRLHRFNPDSPFNDANIGLARVHMAQRVRYQAGAGVRTGGPRFQGRIPDGTAANFLNSYYYHTQVLNRRSPKAISRPETAVKYANLLSGENFTDVQDALSWLRGNGYNVAVGRQRTDDSTATS